MGGNGILCLPLVEQVFEWHEVAETLLGVLVVAYRYEPYAFFGKHDFKIVVHLYMLSPEAAQILADYTVYPAALDVLHHTLERRAVEIRPAPAVVRIFFDYAKAVLPGILSNERSLRLYADAVSESFVVTA